MNHLSSNGTSSIDKASCIITIIKVVISIFFLVFIIHHEFFPKLEDISHYINLMAYNNEAAKITRDDFISKCESLDYDSIARNPDKYKGVYIKIKGCVWEIDDDWNRWILGVSTEKEWAVWCEGDVTVMLGLDNDADMILEEDMVTFYGICGGKYDYNNEPLIYAIYYDIEQ